MSSRSIEHIRKRKNEDEDEEMIFVIFPALHLYLSRRKRQKRHHYFLYGKEHVRELLSGHLKNCLTAFRMEPHIFMWLASYLRNEGLISDTRIKVEEKLAFFLYMLSHNASYEDLQLEFRHSGQIFSKYINQFFDIIPTLATRIVKPLNLDEPHPKITADPRWQQSGVGWDESTFKLEAEPHLWDNLEISFGTRIKRFKQKSFPLYDSLGELYHKHTAEGSYNFTSTAEQCLKPEVADVESDEDESGDEDLQILEKPEVEHVQVNERNADVEHAQVNPRNADVENAQVNQKKAPGPSTSKNKKPKKSPKKSSGDGLVGVIERFVTIKEKQAEEERAEAKEVNKFTISKCIEVVHTMTEITAHEKVKAFKVFKTVENRETFLTSAAMDRETAILWLQQEIAELP